MYRTDSEIADEFNCAPETSPYSTLVKTFELVEKKGWDIARLNWLLSFNIVKPTDPQTISLFGSVDEQVFCFIKNLQRHSYETVCSRVDCTEKVINRTTTELNIL